MARKTFISYKHSEACGVRDRIIMALGDDATFYQGETVSSPDLTDTSTENIKNCLKEMMHGTSVTIVVISPSMTKSRWIEWEIQYSLKEIRRADRVSRTNGVVGVIMKLNDGYDWLVTSSSRDDGCSVRTIDTSRLNEIINRNRYNVLGGSDACKHCKTYSQLDGSYIALIEEDKFIDSPSEYIENAFSKCQRIEDYKIIKEI